MLIVRTIVKNEIVTSKMFISDQLLEKYIKNYLNAKQLKEHVSKEISEQGF